MKKSKGSVVVWIIVIVIILLIIAALMGWWFFIRKSPEGGRCKNTARCEQSLKCVSNTCSSGKADSNCGTYKDCASKLTCKQNKCETMASYTQYFDQVKISKMKPGMPPGPNNVPTETKAFETSDGIEVDLVGVKPTATGSFYYELVNPTTGETVFSSKDNKQFLTGQDRGTGSDLPVPPGTYDFNLIYNDMLVYTTQITVTN